MHMHASWLYTININEHVYVCKFVSLSVCQTLCQSVEMMRIEGADKEQKGRRKVKNTI